MTVTRSRLKYCLAGLLVMGSPALLGSASAQDLEFEQVGDIPVDAETIAFDEAANLWAASGDLFRLKLGSTSWEEVSENTAGFGRTMLVVSPDTLFLTQNSAVSRSTDGGTSFEGVYDEGHSLFAADLDGPNDGVILAGTDQAGSGISYSTDRGASFTESTIPVSTSWETTLESAVEIPDGVVAGRIVAGCFNGIVFSDDSGQTWELSSVFQEARFAVRRMVIGKHPTTGERRLYATLTDSQEVGVRLYVSDDDGLTWTDVPGMVDAYLIIYAQEMPFSLLAVERADAVDGERLAVWHSLNGGESWTMAGELPAEINGDGIFSEDLLIGPDEHLYVSVSRAGSAHEWVYRTTEPVVVANQPELPSPTGQVVSVYPNPATDWITVEAVGLSGEAVLYDLLGREVRRARLVSGQAKFDTVHLPSGVYVVRIGSVVRRISVL